MTTRVKLVNGLLVVTGVLLGLILMHSVANAVTKSGTVTVSGSVPGPPPTTAATINVPVNGDVFHTNPITVAGSCPDEGLLISIYDNGNFVGSTTCNSSGSYSLKIDLYVGNNRLVAREQDSLNQYGPDSAAVSVTYSPSTDKTTSPAIAQLSIVLDPSRVGFTNSQKNELLSVPLKIIGGKAPYAVYIDWGDGNSSLMSQANTDSFVIAHKYTEGGNFQVNLKASDSSGQQANLTVAIIINGKASVVAQTRVTNNRLPTLLWWLAPFIGILLLAVGYVFGARSHRKNTTFPDTPVIN